MRISDIALSRQDSDTHLTATVTWDAAARHPFELYIKTGNAPPTSADQAANALLCALFPIAFHDREPRLAVDGPACPMLVDNLQTVLGWWNHWGCAPRHTMQIEAKGAAAPMLPRAPATAFLSGGIDSFHMLQRNRKLYAPGTPMAITNGILVHGFDVGRRQRNAEHALFDHVRDRIAGVAATAGVPLSTASTNLRHITHTPGFWFDRMFGAACIAMGHAVAPGFSYLLYAGSYNIDTMVPIGSNPTVDIQFSSQRLQVVHEGVVFSRLEKLRELADWTLALDNLRVCAEAGRSALNCGACEKCLRTRMELLAVGVTETQSFGRSAFDAGLLDHIEIYNSYQAACYRDAANALAGGPYAALARAAEERLRLYHANAAAPAVH